MRGCKSPDCHKWANVLHAPSQLIGVTRDELLLTPKPILSLLFPDLGLGAKLYDELTPHRPSEMADSLTKAQPYYGVCCLGVRWLPMLSWPQ